MYGFARGLIGPYFGFLVGIFEFFGSVTLLGVFSTAFGQSVAIALGLSDIYVIVFLLIPLVASVILQNRGRPQFEKVVKVLTIFCLFLFLIYVFGSAAHVSREKYGKNSNAKPPSDTYKMREVFQRSNYGAAFFAGIEGLPVVSSEAQRVSSFAFLPLIPY